MYCFPHFLWRLSCLWNGWVGQCYQRSWTLTREYSAKTRRTFYDYLYFWHNGCSKGCDAHEYGCYWSTYIYSKWSSAKHRKCTLLFLFTALSHRRTQYCWISKYGNGRDGFLCRYPREFPKKPARSHANALFGSPQNLDEVSTRNSCQNASKSIGFIIKNPIH